MWRDICFLENFKPYSVPIYEKLPQEMRKREKKQPQKIKGEDYVACYGK
jgi:hypothetical protein